MEDCCFCWIFFLPLPPNMEKLLLIAEEGERKLISEVAMRLDKLSEGQGCADWLSEYEVRVTGVGALNVMRALRDVSRDTELLNIGYVGSANFEIGSLVEVTDVCLNHPNVTYPEPELHLKTGEKQNGLIQARCYTGTDFVLQSDYRDCVFDMELAFIAGMGFQNIRALKIVSDNLSLHTYHTVANGVE